MKKKQQVIIFDGVDGCAKTEMGQELSRRIDVPYFKNADEHKYFLKHPGYFIDAIRYVDTYFTSYLEASGASVILDRAWPSEFVYSQALNRQTDFGILRELDDRHAALGTRIIVPFRTDYRNVRDDYDTINDNLLTIHDLYCEFVEWSNCETLLLNVDDENLDRELADILAFLGDK